MLIGQAIVIGGPKEIVNFVHEWTKGGEPLMSHQQESAAMLLSKSFSKITQTWH